VHLTIASLWCSNLSQVTPHPARSGWSKRRQRATLSLGERVAIPQPRESRVRGPFSSSEVRLPSNLRIRLQFVTDAEGHKSAVILPIEEYEEMMEDLAMGRAARESKGEPRRPFENVVKEWRAAGEIDV